MSELNEGRHIEPLARGLPVPGTRWQRAARLIGGLDMLWVGCSKYSRETRGGPRLGR